MPLTLPNGAWLLDWPRTYGEWNQYLQRWELDPSVMVLALALGYYSQRVCGQRLWILSGRRSTSEQASLFARAQAGGSTRPAAKPGDSLHEIGLAFDVGTDRQLDGREWECVGRLGEALGLTWGGRFSAYDPNHFQRTGPGAGALA
jgi:hypothetical protein